MSRHRQELLNLSPQSLGIIGLATHPAAKAVLLHTAMLAMVLPLITAYCAIYATDR